MHQMGQGYKAGVMLQKEAITAPKSVTVVKKVIEDTNPNKILSDTKLPSSIGKGARDMKSLVDETLSKTITSKDSEAVISQKVQEAFNGAKALTSVVTPKVNFSAQESAHTFIKAGKTNYEKLMDELDVTCKKTLGEQARKADLMKKYGTQLGAKHYAQNLEKAKQEALSKFTEEIKK